MEQKIESLLEKAWEIENKSIIAYIGWIRMLSEIGIKNEKIAEFVARIIKDSLVHKRIVEAITQALNDIETVEDELERRGRLTNLTMECDEELFSFLKRMVKEHEEIERDAVRVYRELASSVDNQLISKIFAYIAEDEERHDTYLDDLENVFQVVCGQAD